MSFNKEYEHSVDVSDLYFSYGGPPIIDHLDLKLNAGNRCILVGANGAGKTTLLRILAGKRMIPGQVKVLGKDAFVDAPQVKKKKSVIKHYTFDIHHCFMHIGYYLFGNRMGQ
jgi:ABC-type multidrug transport system ATPase subunit